MREQIINAWEELKRADHLMYVSLKYTRTGDVIKSIVERLINSFDFIIDAILEKAEEENKIIEIPNTPIQKVNQIKNLYGSDQPLHDLLNFYLLLRKIIQAKTSVVKEFRRHVTLTVMLENKSIEINIDIIHEYYDKSREFFDYVRNQGYI